MPNDPVFLYAEDDPLSRTVMSVLVEQAMPNAHLTMFEDTKDFMKKIEALPRKPDVIFLDIHIRPDDGFAVLEMLRNHEHYKDSTIIAVTASVMSEEVEQLQQAGFDGGIAKPIDHDRFPELLALILRGESIWHIV